MPERVFLIFLLFFSEFSCPGRVWTEFGTKIFLSFSAYLIPFWLGIMPEIGFLIFLIFFKFFRNFLAWVKYERNSGLIFLSLFFGLSHPVLAINNAGKRFFNFFEFICYFFWNFHTLVDYERNLGLKVFYLFLGLSHPVLAKNNAGKSFLIFWIFLLFFSEFSCLSRVWTKFGTKILFILFRPISSRFG